MSGDFNSIDPLLVGLTFVIVGVNAGNLCKADFPKRSVLAGEIWNCRFGVSKCSSLLTKPQT